MIYIYWKFTHEQHLGIPLQEMKSPSVLLFPVYPPKGEVLKNLRFLECACIIAHIPLMQEVGSAGFEPAIFRLK